MFGEHVPSYRKFRAFSYTPCVQTRFQYFGGPPPGLQGVVSLRMVGGVSAFLSQIANIAKMSTKDLEEAGLRRLFIASEMSVWRQPFLCTSGSYGTKHVGFRVGVWPTYNLNSSSNFSSCFFFFIIFSASSGPISLATPSRPASLISARAA